MTTWVLATSEGHANFRITSYWGRPKAENSVEEPQHADSKFPAGVYFG